MLQKIRLSIFYTDEEIYSIVQKSGVLTKMLSWGNEFFKRYNFEIDIFPIPYSKNYYEETFILQEKDGLTVPFQFLEGIDTLEERSEVLSKEILKLKRERKDVRDLEARQTAIVNLKEGYKNQVRDSWSKIRIQCHNKFRDDYPVKTPARLVVIFCRSEQPQYTLSGGTVDVREWKPFVVLPVVGGKDDFTILNIMLNRSYKTLAHEIVHSAGELHPEKGGSFDGPKNSVMNYNATDLLPSQVILEPKHLALLKIAFFTI